MWDVERGAPNKIIDQPWQSCSCIGGWHYNTSIYEKNEYKSAAYVAKLLVDIVSKNGNLLLSVPLRADGTFDEKEEKILNEFGAWMNINKEAIYDTRPWVVFGEGPIAEEDIPLNAQGFNEGSYSQAGAKEIRFTQTPKYLYVGSELAINFPFLLLELILLLKVFLLYLIPLCSLLRRQRIILDVWNVSI